jgi:hypothetical protein
MSRKRFGQWATGYLLSLFAILSGGVDAHVDDLIHGANVDLAQLLPGDPLHVSTTSGDLFDIGRMAGFNTFRVTTFAEWAPAQRGTSYSGEAWKSIGVLAEQHGITLIPLLGLSRQEEEAIDRQANADSHAKRRTSAYIAKIDRILGALTATRCRVIIDLGNERELNEEEIVRFRILAAHVHSAYPGVPVTVGGWKQRRERLTPGQAAFVANYPLDGAPLVDIVDIVSVHLYDEPLEDHRTFGLYARRADQVPLAVEHYLNIVARWAKGKPILVGEFGAPNGVLRTRYSSPLGPINPTVQQETIAGVLDGVNTARRNGIHVAGALVWIMVPRGGPGAIHDESNEWALSLIDDNARTLNFFPAFWEFCRKPIFYLKECTANHLNRIPLAAFNEN